MTTKFYYRGIFCSGQKDIINDLVMVNIDTRILSDMLHWKTVFEILIELLKQELLRTSLLYLGLLGY